MELTPGTRIGDKYQLVRPIGQGGMGAVWEAVNDAVGKRVAIKLLEPSLAKQPEFMRRFELEAQASALIDHPDIVDVLDTGTTEWGAPFMVMEFLQGITLRQLIKRFKQVTLGQAVAALAPVLDALGAAHEAGIIHRDLKPANIFLAVKPRPAVKVLDFGISKFQQSDGMTKTGVTLGTPAYMAPEQVRDSRTAGRQADLYSVGAMLYAMLSGRAPFEGDSDLAIVAQVLTETPPPLRQLNPELPDELYELVDALLSKDPKHRPASAPEVRELLRAMAPPDEAWLFSRVRELTPTESKAALKVPLERPVSRSGSRSSTSPRATPHGKTAAPLEEAPGKTITNSTRAAPASQKGLLLGLGAVMVLLVAALVFIVTRPAPAEGSAAPPTPEPEPVAALAPPPATPATPKVELTLKAEPASALFHVADAPACNPCQLTRAQGSKLVAKVSADGFADAEVTLDFDAARLVTVALQPLAAEPVKPVAKPKRPQPKKGLEIDETNPYPSR
ncbi:MAG: serine/threonine-protein kinase [Myxococcota bacterium]